MLIFNILLISPTAAPQPRGVWGVKKEVIKKDNMIKSKYELRSQDKDESTETKPDTSFL